MAETTREYSALAGQERVSRLEAVPTIRFYTMRITHSRNLLKRLFSAIYLYTVTHSGVPPVYDGIEKEVAFGSLTIE